jgi:hypothetical protein
MRTIAHAEHFPIVEKPLLGNTLLESIRRAWASEGDHSAKH